ncbi:unnamed protein product [Rotaria magnacalcarata]|uniref:Uncharacterized protein n=1 Tax=Rotaria magnacalcarata TaxID=392030 RepID=A0A816V501_9BILA|nr:unnamed protein product [Rotaria magnacalcarata]
MNPSNEIRRRFYEFYKNQMELNVVDAFVCFHPASMCELYMPFNRSIIVIASTRYELGRFEPDQWQKWNANLKEIASDPRNLVAANNLYDVEYIRYFTGLNVTLLPSFCSYTNVHYNPTRKEFLLAATHNFYFEDFFLKQLDKYLKTVVLSDMIVIKTKALYKHYKYSALSHHPAIIHVPYQVSTMSLFEQYRMSIPLLVPSLDLLTEWQYQYGVVNERTWDNLNYGKRPNGSRITGESRNVPDPNDEFDRNAIRYWLNFSDFYQWPHFVYYNSIEDLAGKLFTTDFQDISVKMKSYNRQLRYSLLKKWRKILKNIKLYSKKFH